MYCSHTESNSGEHDRENPCNRALLAIRSAQRNITTNRIRSEQRRNFAPYSTTSATRSSKSKVKSWNIKMFCLSDCSQCRVPCKMEAKVTLLEAGLGDKVVHIPNIKCSREEFRQKIFQTFPKLDGCGGFELMRCIANSKNLEVIPSNVSHSPSLLKSVIGNSKVYLRPIQDDLDITPISRDVTSSPEVHVYIYNSFLITVSIIHCQP